MRAILSGLGFPISAYSTDSSETVIANLINISEDSV